MNYVIVGAGGCGGSIAAYLARAVEANVAIPKAAATPKESKFFNDFIRAP